MQNRHGKVLIVDDDVDVLTAARLLLKQHIAVVHTESDPSKVPSLLKNEQYDCILLDMNFEKDLSGGQEGFFWLDRIQSIDPSAVVILITAYGDVELAVRAIKEGAVDFVLKPWQNEKLIATVSAAMNLRRSRTEADQARSRQRQLAADLDQPYHDIIGKAPSMQEVFTAIEKVAATDANVLILGENGTGKELVARAIHRYSNRADEVFITVDLGALSETLFESELFGHVKGAFTDAREDRAGRFEIASGGTLFLDEIGNLSPAMQAKLLTVLQNRTITRLGSNKVIPIDIRLICATNMDLEEMGRKHTFRQDLLYRINTVEIHLPALRERQEDIPLLVEHFLDVYSRKYRKPRKRLNTATLNKLQKYRWPGNVRELQHAVERAVIMSDDQVLQPSDFLLKGSETAEDELRLEEYNLEDVEKMVIRKALQKHGGNMSQASRELGLTRASLYRRLEKYGL